MGNMENSVLATIVGMLMAVAVLLAFAQAIYTGIVVVHLRRTADTNTIASSSYSSGEWQEEDW